MFPTLRQIYRGIVFNHLGQPDLVTVAFPALTGLALGLILLWPTTAWPCGRHDKLCRAEQLRELTVPEAGAKLLKQKPPKRKEQKW